MADKKVIAVLGATGAQGGALVRAILRRQDREASRRARSRATSTRTRPRRWRQQAPTWSPLMSTTRPACVNAFAGAHGAFCVTFFWAHFSPERELAEAAAMARAIEPRGVSHAIWSTLEDTRKFVPLDDDRMPTLMGKYKVPHFDAKGEADAFFLASGVPTTLLLTSFYWDNFIYFGSGPQAGPRRHAGADLPDGIGQVARVSPPRTSGDPPTRSSRLARGRSTRRLASRASTSRLTRWPRPARAPWDAPCDTTRSPRRCYRGFGFPGADDLGNMFQFKRDFNAEFCGARDLKKARALNPAMQTFEQCSLRTSGGSRSHRSSAAHPARSPPAWPGCCTSCRCRRRLRRLHRRAVLRLVRQAPGVGLRRPSAACALRAARRAGDLRRLDRRAAGAGGDLWRAGRLPHRVAFRPARRVALRAGDRVRGSRLVAAAAGALRVLLDERHRVGAVAGAGRHARRDRTPRRCALVAALRRAGGRRAAHQAHRDHVRRGAWRRHAADTGAPASAEPVAMGRRGSGARRWRLPNALWQHAHGWPSLEFYRNAALYKNNPASAGEILMQQVLFMSPGVLPVTLAGLVWLWRRPGAQLRHSPFSSSSCSGC